MARLQLFLTQCAGQILQLKECSVRKPVLYTGINMIKLINDGIKPGLEM